MRRSHHREKKPPSFEYYLFLNANINSSRPQISMANDSTEHLVDEYDVLSIHSSDNELDDEANGEGTANIKHSASQEELLSDIEGLESTDTGEQTDTELSESLDGLASVISGAAESSGTQQRYLHPQAFWSFPGTSLSGSEVLAPLDDELSCGSQSLNIMDPSNALKFSPNLMNFLTQTSKRRVFSGKLMTEQTPRTSLRYIVMSGAYRPHFQPFIHKVHERFPLLDLLWVDTAEQTFSWITEGQTSLPSPEDLLSGAIRMDFYSTRGDHKISSHRYIEELILPGYLNLGIIPVAPFNVDAASHALTSSTAPCELDSRHRLVPLSRPESLDAIRMAHLISVKHNPSLIRFTELRRKNSFCGLSACASRLSKPLLWLLGPLILVILYTQANTVAGMLPSFYSSFSLSSDAEMNLKHWPHDFGPPPAFKGPHFYFRIDSKSNEPAGAESVDMSEVPSTVRASAIEDIEEFFRRAAINFLRLMRQAQSLAHDFYASARDFSQERLKSSPLLHAVQDRAAEQWDKHLGRYYKDFVFPRWLQGRERAARWMQ